MAEGTFICGTSVASDFMGATTVNLFDDAEKRDYLKICVNWFWSI
jgi:hypothetical protein